MLLIRIALLGAVVCLPLTGIAVTGVNPSYSEHVTPDTVPFYTGGDYDPSIPAPNDHLRHMVGQWPLRHGEMARYLEVLAAASDRVSLESYGESYEGRRLYNVFVGSPENLARRGQIRKGMALLADPERIASPRVRDSLISALPSVVWLGYTVHGDELAPCDAAVQLLYHLAAARDEATRLFLDSLLIIIDPLQNPDGRDRFVAMLDQYRSLVPNYDRRSLHHRGVFPWGRANHYLFDLNRDAILLRQQESVGRVATISAWHPQLVVDAHGMGHNDTHLFSPPDDPVHPGIPPSVMKWYDVFAADNARAFDARGWPYYTGEWHDAWYPGYGSQWSTFGGAVGILYETARVGGSSLRQSSGYLLTYHEAVNKIFASSLANLTTAARHRTALLTDYHDTRRRTIERGRESGLTFVFAPTDDDTKLRRFIEALMIAGIRVERATADFRVAKVTDVYGRTIRSKAFPAGSFLVREAQPEGALAKAILEFDPRLDIDVLRNERKALEKRGETEMYETSTWSLPLAYGLDAHWTTEFPRISVERVTTLLPNPGKLHNPGAQFAFIADMAGEKTYLLLNRLFADGISVYGSEKAFTVEEHLFKPGALVIRKRGNPDNVADLLADYAGSIGIDVYGVNTGLSSEGSLLGAPTFSLLRPTRAAIVSGPGMSYTSFGTIWFTLDRELQMPLSILEPWDLGEMDLSIYNVLILPSSWGPLDRSLHPAATGKLSAWVEGGGTLIAVRQSAAWAADTARAFSQVRLKSQVLDQLSLYQTGLEREQQAEKPLIDTLALWHPEKVPPGEVEEKPSLPGGKAARQEDEWQRKFSPQGVYMQVNLDLEHWLAFGMTDRAPAFMDTRDAFMAMEPDTTVGRLAGENQLRVSGLLWPEARKRWANTAYLTRESKGRGQVILFAGEPDYRAYHYGTRQLLLNAILYGPGMGTWKSEY